LRERNAQRHLRLGRDVHIASRAAFGGARRTDAPVSVDLFATDQDRPSLRRFARLRCVVAARLLVRQTLFLRAALRLFAEAPLRLGVTIRLHGVVGPPLQALAVALEHGEQPLQRKEIRSRVFAPYVADGVRLARRDARSCLVHELDAALFAWTLPGDSA
jgi:hypothetical protein